MAAIPAISSLSLRKMSDDDIRKLISSTEPDIIIHTAAISDIASCEHYPEASYRANVEIPVAITRTGISSLYHEGIECCISITQEPIQNAEPRA